MRRKNNVFLNKSYSNYKYATYKVIQDFYGFTDLKTFFKNHIKYKFEHHLMWADKSGMYFSLETRFPFIDHNLIEKTLSTKNRSILKEGWTKAILREALENKLDNKIRLRKDKIGFETPEKEWIKQGEFQTFIHDILNSTTFNERPFFDAKKIKSLYQTHLSNQENHANIIWKCIHLNYYDEKIYR